MNKKILALSLVLLLTTMYVSSVSFSPVKAQSNGWITSYQVFDYTTKSLLVNYDSSKGVNQTLGSISPGQQIYCTFAVNVFTGGSGDLSLSTSLRQLLQGQYWQLVTQNYSLGSVFNPNSNHAQFAWVQGTFTMTVYGIVPTPSSTTGQAPVNVVSLYGPDGSLLSQITVYSTSAGMASFQTLLSQKNANLNSLISSGVNSGYIQLYTSVLNASLAVANAGDITDATAMLNDLNSANAPPSSTAQALFLPLIVVVAVVAVVFAFLWFRVRGKVSYFQLVVEDQIKDLEGLTLRISKIDRALSSNLESVKDRLKRLVGM
jgi:hypothetical protein